MKGYVLRFGIDRAVTLSGGIRAEICAFQHYSLIPAASLRHSCSGSSSAYFQRNKIESSVNFYGSNYGRSNRANIGYASKFVGVRTNYLILQDFAHLEIFNYTSPK